ncbi:MULTISPECIES: DUF6566 family protein [unclassified Caballeronia]|uniref:DUF6566 family protein n=1 Tax=unclassified Caballeronia TaxID=2646786 RepID=UPI002865E0C9|nr:MULTISPECIES: DUF6566 family protein [unclassified Caballeronia]MDR5740415.1 hypothetical protein [Caballeronia sp. LZ016]MDR5808406.1 hypothetical protein [Caballeronia sp. LZ019]
MHNERFSFDGYDVTVTAEQVSTGDWTSRIEAFRDNQPVALPDVETLGPNWSTSDEAVRAGVEQARRLIDRYCRGHDDQHTDRGIGSA